MKRFFALLLCMLMCVSMLPAVAFAEPADLDYDNSETEKQHSHELVYVSREEPDCNGGNDAYYICSECNRMFSDADGLYEISEIPQLAPKHTRPENKKEIKTVPPTCTKDGSVEYICAVCNKKVVEVLHAHGKAVPHYAVAETCTTAGSIAYYECSKCGRIYTDENATNEISYEDTVVEALGHSLTKVEAHAATCAAEGNREYWKCTREGCNALFADADGNVPINLQDVTIIKTKDHHLTRHSANNPTCTERGNIECWKCDICGGLFSDASATNEITLEQVALECEPHQLVKTDAISATCEDDGNIEYWTCSVCGRCFKDAMASVQIQRSETIVTKLGHALKEVAAKPACLEDGTIQHWICEREDCGKLFSDETGTKEIAVADTVVHRIGHHDYNGGVCSICKAEDPDYKGPSFKDADLTYTPGQPLVIRIDADYETSIDNNWSITINGITIDPAFIEVSEGSTVFTISTEGMKRATLEAGENNEVAVQVKQGTVRGPLDVKSPPTVKINPEITHGNVTVITTTPVVGSEVVLTITPDENYALKTNSLSVKDMNGSGLTVSKVPGKTDEFKFTMPDSDVIVTAEFVEGFTVSFKANGHGTAPTEQKVPSGGHAIEPPAPTAEGFTFGGWFEKSSTTAFDFENMEITEDTELFAKWIENCTVTFNTNGHGTAPAPESIAPGEKAKKPTDPTADACHKFGGWFTKATCKDSEEYDFNKPVTQNITLYAKWTDNHTFNEKPKQSEGVCTRCMEEDPNFEPKILEGVKGHYGTAYYGYSHTFVVNTYFPYVKDSVEVRVDGKKLSPGKDGQYDLKDGTTKVILKASYIRSLATGDHKIHISTNLGPVSGYFRVSSSPKTGDDSNIALWVTVGVISAAGVAGITYYLLKKRKK